MDNILEEFTNEMDLLMLYIEFQNESYKKFSKNEKSKVNSKYKNLTTAKIKQFDFNSHIISVYGAFERFIEKLLDKYLSSITLIVESYRDLPNEIKKNNLQKTLDILNQIDYRKNRNIRADKIIEILHLNFKTDNPNINIEAFKNHKSNFRMSTIDLYFSEIGIKNVSNNIRSYDPLKQHLQQHLTNYSSKKNTVVFQIIEWLCDLRNDIAHGEEGIELINKSILFEQIDFLKIFAISLHKLVLDNYLEKVYASIEQEIKTIHIFNDKILCFNTEGKVYTKDSILIGYTTLHKPNYFILKVNSIENNRTEIEKTELDQRIDIGIQLDKKIKASMKFKLWE